MSVKADYFENSNMEYSVRCQVIEQGLPLINLTVTAPTESEAATLQTTGRNGTRRFMR